MNMQHYVSMLLFSLSQLLSLWFF